MNLKIANRLLAYRRAHGYSQEDLAEKIGVSRQAVSKWERAEAAPDTDNLIALAALYGVLIDELINGEGEPEIKSEEASDEPTRESNDTPDPTHNSDDVGINIEDGGDKIHIGLKGIHIVEKNGDEVHIDLRGVRKTKGDEAEEKSDQEDQQRKVTVEGHLELEFEDDWLFVASSILCTIAYLVMGFCLERGWECGWIVFMLVPVVPTLVTAIVKRKPTEFLFPVLVTGLYLVAGMCYGRWHPDWIIFLTVPIYYIIAEAIESRRKKQ